MDAFDESRELKTSLSHAQTQPSATTAERGRKSCREPNGEEIKESERKNTARSTSRRLQSP
jgi:hypothetical protein